jgi:5'-nucleotidase
MPKKIILVDMDGVIADFELGFLKSWQQNHPDLPYFALEQRKSFYVRDQYPQDQKQLVEKIYKSEGFYRNLPVISGSVQAFKELEKSCELFICTSPLSGNKFCIQEKTDWIGEHLGNEWISKMVITKDKTIVRGDVLIDDNPHVKGILTPTWSLVTYKQPYNNGQFTWEDWKKNLESFLKS